MTVPIDLTDPWQRFDWGEIEGKSLELWTKDFSHQNAYMSHVHQDGDRWCWDFVKLIPADDEAALFAQGAQIVGAFLEHMRSALNYLTYQLALHIVAEDPTLAGKVNPNRVEFPIFDDPTTFQNESRVKNFPAQYRDPIEAVQPYGGKHPSLWMLHELAREYRHRVIHPMACYPLGEFEGFTGTLPDFIFDVERPYKGGPLKGGDPLFSCRSPKDFDPNDYPNLMLAIGVDHPLCYGLSCVSALHEIAGEVFAILTEWSSDPWPPIPRTS
jgi:hypothetical protein